MLDPFLGSGTLAKVARSLGRRYVGIELSRPYYDESLKRIGFQQFGELDSVFSELLKSFVGNAGNRSRVEDCRFYFKQLLTARLTEIEVKVSKWCEGFSSVDDVEKKEKPSLWTMGEEFLDALPSCPTAESGLISNIASAYLNSYKLAKHFNGVRLGLIAHNLRRDIEPVLKNDPKLEKMIEHVVSSEPSSYEIVRGGREIVLKQTNRRVKQTGSRRKGKQGVTESEPALF